MRKRLRLRVNDKSVLRADAVPVGMPDQPWPPRVAQLDAGRFLDAPTEVGQLREDDRLQLPAQAHLWRLFTREARPVFQLAEHANGARPADADRVRHLRASERDRVKL